MRDIKNGLLVRSLLFLKDLKMLMSKKFFQILFRFREPKISAKNDSNKETISIVRDEISMTNKEKKNTSNSKRPSIVDFARGQAIQVQKHKNKNKKS